MRIRSFHSLEATLGHFEVSPAIGVQGIGGQHGVCPVAHHPPVEASDRLVGFVKERFDAALDTLTGHGVRIIRRIPTIVN
jgi:hypothetical protein